MSSKTINNVMIVIRFIGILFSLWTLFLIFIGVYRISLTASFQTNKINSIMVLVPTSWPPLTLSILFLLPWKRIKDNKVWTSLFCLLIIAAIVDIRLIYKYAMYLNLVLALFVISIIVMQIIGIAVIKQIRTVRLNKPKN